MKDQILFSGKNKRKVINLLSAKLAEGMEVVNFVLFFVQSSKLLLYCGSDMTFFIIDFRN